LLTTYTSLPENKDDRTLEIALTREFSKYGTVFVKIRRDGHNMPFAFCQYTVSTSSHPFTSRSRVTAHTMTQHDEDAKQAMEMGRGAVVLGRACRTEMVKANRKSPPCLNSTGDGVSFLTSHEAPS